MSVSLTTPKSSAGPACAERCDGPGYPDELAREDIPLGLRIIFVADALDAMTSTRAYQAIRTEVPALAELHRCAGSQFDPAVIAVLKAALYASSEKARHAAEGCLK